ncbi:hypothetical protein AB5I41_29570 [Sphingomonas sp. MMS24-JH45]
MALLEMAAEERPRLHRPADHHRVEQPVAAGPIYAGIPLRREGKGFDYVLGLFGFYQSITTEGLQRQGPAASRWFINPSNALANDPSVLDGLTANNDIRLKNFSGALFGKLNWNVTDTVTIFPGARLNYDDKVGSYVSVACATVRATSCPRPAATRARSSSARCSSRRRSRTKRIARGTSATTSPPRTSRRATRSSTRPMPAPSNRAG